MGDDTIPGRTPRPRHDGWTAERRARFLASIRQTGNVRAAVTAAGMGRASAYRLRDRPGTFARQWDRALARFHRDALDARLAKATLALRALRKGHASHIGATAHPLAETGRGEQPAENAPHCQACPPCLPRDGDSRRPRHAAHWAIIDAAGAQRC